jgi:hypothetical protein
MKHKSYFRRAVHDINVGLIKIDILYLNQHSLTRGAVQIHIL